MFEVLHGAVITGYLANVIHIFHIIIDLIFLIFRSSYVRWYG